MLRCCCLIAPFSASSLLILLHLLGTRTRTRTNTNPNDTEANAAGRSGNARALRKQSKCGVIHKGEGHWPNFSQILQKSEAFVGSAHSAEAVKRKSRERSSLRAEHEVPLAEVKICLSARRAPIVLSPGHERPWQGRNSFLVRRVAVNREVPLKYKQQRASGPLVA